MLAVSMPNLATFAAFVETATKCLATAFASSPSAVEQPVARGLRVGHRFERRERFRRDDEQRFGRVEIVRRLGEIGAVDIRDEAKCQRAIAVVPQRFVGHHRAEVGAADADVDDVANAFAGVAHPGAAADALGEGGHLVEHRMNCRHDILAVDHDRGALRRPQRDVQHGAILGDVDLLAAEHGVDSAAHVALFGELKEQLERFVGDAVLRVIEEDADGLGGHPLAARGVSREELPQVRAASLLGIDGERLPCGR